MKILFSAIICIITMTATSQTPYTYTNDGSGIVLNGIVTKYILQNDSSFTWYKQSQQGYTPDAAIVQAMAAAKDNVTFIIFGGTWCSDTQAILPKFFKLQEQSGFPDNRIAFFAMDRSKKTIGNIGTAMGITNVPTIVVMKNGVESGRIIEYGKTGQWDKELADLLTK